MTLESFVATYPNLFHMATAQALPTLEKFGLLSTNAILQLCEVENTRAELLRSTRRPEMTLLEHPEHGVFYLRDQKPMRDAALAECLDDMAIPDWYRTLNSRVFMWSSRERVEKLLEARAYRSSDQLVLTIDTASFASKYFDAIEVSTLNSGATLYKPLRRGPQTFVPLSLFNDSKGSKAIVEVTVPGGIPDFMSFVIEAKIRKVVGTA